MALNFLEDAMIIEDTIIPGTFYHYSPETDNLKNEHMVLDSQCL
jgi:hypothetical protein